MNLQLMYITNKPEVAVLAQKAGVERIFVDLEINGKIERQGHLDTVISHHTLEDVLAVKAVLTTSKLLVRVNPIFDGSKKEIDDVIAAGADVVMLPMFTTAEEVAQFVKYVDGRARTCLLLETAPALARLDDILEVPGIDEIHVGLNDLHLSMHLDFIFELLADGIVEYICSKIAAKKIPYGFGGIARVGLGMLPAEYIIAEHHRLGSKMAILSRSFCDANKRSVEEVQDIFMDGVNGIKDFEHALKFWTVEDFARSHLVLKEKVARILREKKNK